jgi:glutamyl-tRNA reductase
VTLLAVGVSHRSAPLALRERVELTKGRATALLASLTGRPEIDEAASLSTCNRTELYLVATDVGDAQRLATAALARTGGARPEELGAAIQTARGREAVRHLFRVAAGLDSMILGEGEIQGQVRRSYELALSLGTSGSITNRLFQDALRAGKRVRSETGISRHGASVATVAVELARREVGDLRGRRALVLGAGKHGALTAHALADAGVRTVFMGHGARERAEDLARRFDGRAVGFDDLAAELRRCDVVLTCTSCPYHVVTCRQLAAAAKGRRLLVVDTAVPRDVEPAARGIPGVTLYDLDDIQRETARNLSARKEAALRAEPIVEEEVASFERWLALLEVVPTISALRERGRAAVERALRENEARWQALTDDDRERVELVARAVVSDLLHQPTLTLKREGGRGAAPLYVQTVRELFGLGP